MWDHWPVLLTIFLFGSAIRAAVLWGAMKATLWHAWAGQALLPLAPLATVAALILALRVVAPPGSVQQRRHRVGSLLPDDLGVDVAPRLTTLKVTEPAKRSAGIRVADVAELVSKLKNEAKVI